MQNNILLTDIDRQQLRELKRTFNRNYRILSLYARLLNENPTAIKKDLMDELCSDGTNKLDAYTSVLAYIFDLDDEDPEDALLLRKYLIPSIFQADKDKYLSCEYRNIILGSNVTCGSWTLSEDKYMPYEAFPCGEMVSLPDFTEYPRIAFFDHEFSFPQIKQNGVEWMSLKPNELETMAAPIANAEGNTVVFGLGLGYFAYAIAQKPNVKSVTVVERDKDVISLFKNSVLPNIENREKISIIECDAFDFMQRDLEKTHADYAFTDIWHDTSDGFEFFLKTKKYEHKLKNAKFDYWIRTSILLRMRQLVFEDYTSNSETKNFTGLPHVCGVDMLKETLSLRSLDSLAKIAELNDQPK